MQVIMKGKLIPVFVLAALVSCSQPPVKEQGPRPVKLADVTSLNMVEKSFSGVVSPDQFSDLAFKMSGPLISLNVDEGQKVRTGQIVAEIDPLDFKWEYEAKKASFQTAEAQLQRAKKLLSKQAISKQEYESTEASYSNAKAAFEYAQNTLNQTKLRAPFDGFIQKKYVENYQKVQAGQGIVCLINPNKLQVVFTMPESNINYFSSPYSVYVEFDNYKGVRFKAKVKEYVEASPDGSGVPVYLYIDDPNFNLEKYKVAVGFSCRVILNVDSESFTQGAVLVPLAAVVADDANSDKYVFVYNGQSQKVERRKITESMLIGKDGVIVTDGLRPGEQVVSAGATRLVDGQQVKGRAGRSLLLRYMGYVPQESNLIQELSVRDNLLLWYRDKHRLKKELEEGFLHTLGVQQMCSMRAQNLSGGMKKRVSIGCALAESPVILLLDEPNAALDLPAKEQIREYLLQYRSQGGTVLLATHDESDLEICDSVYALCQGRMKEIDRTLRGKQLVEELE